MRAIQFPGRAEHRHSHRALLLRLEGFLSDFKAGRQVASKDVLRFLSDWTAHQTGSDMALAPYIRAARVGKAFSMWAAAGQRAVTA